MLAPQSVARMQYDEVRPAMAEQAELGISAGPPSDPGTEAVADVSARFRAVQSSPSCEAAAGALFALLNLATCPSLLSATVVSLDELERAIMASIDAAAPLIPDREDNIRGAWGSAREIMRFLRASSEERSRDEASGILADFHDYVCIIAGELDAQVRWSAIRKRQEARKRAALLESIFREAVRGPILH